MFLFNFLNSFLKFILDDLKKLDVQFCRHYAEKNQVLDLFLLFGIHERRLFQILCWKKPSLRFFLLPGIHEGLLSGGHGLIVRGYDPLIKTLAKGLDIRLHIRYVK